jgi:signal transduction histidine kinase
VERVFLQVPFLTAEAAATAARARTSPEAVLLAGGPGRGAYRVARALHGADDLAGFVSVRLPLAESGDLDRRIRSVLSGDPHLDRLCVYVERIELQPPSVQENLVRLADEGVRWRGRTIPVRVVAQTDRGAGAALASLPPSLRAPFSIFVIALPPLSERGREVPAIAELLVGEASRRIDRAAPPIDAEAQQRLVTWPGTVEELESALRRAVHAGEGRPIRAADLGPFDTTSAPAAPPPAAGAPEPLSAAAEKNLDTPRIEAVITELAHELKNPMVTIKTFAQHMDHLLADAELREKFTRLTNEAVDRMDAFLDELLQFSRFSLPNPRPVALADMITRSVSMSEAENRERLHSNGIPEDFRVMADEEQIAFAVCAAIRGLVRELPADTSIVLSSAASNEIVLRANVPGMKGKLQNWLHHENGSGAENSLHFVLAEALVARNGGLFRVVRRVDSIEARMTLPVAAV